MAYDCNGSGARISCNGFISSAIGTGNFTYTCLVNSRNVLSTTQKGLVQASTISGGLSTSYVDGFSLAFGWGLNGANFTGGFGGVVGGVLIGVNTAIITTDTWYSVALSRASGLCKLHVNGNLHVSASAPNSLPATNICLSGYYDSTYTLVGTVAECAFYSAALTDAEILSLARGFTPDQICPQSLQFYAPLVRNLQDLRGGRVISNNGATVATHPRIIT